MSVTLLSVATAISQAILGAIGSVLPQPVSGAVTNVNTVDGLAALIFAAILLLASMLNTIVLIWWERKLLGRFMDRRGAMHVGYAGLLQNFADGIKLFRKDTVKPREADTLGFWSGPTAYMVTSLIIFAILPVSTGWNSGSLPLSLLLALAVFSFAPLFIFVSAWSSNNKYSLIGGMRSAAQMIAYEVPILLAVVAVVLVSGSFDLQTIVLEQTNYWFWVPLFLALVVFVAGMLAEMERIPFDLPEAEAELVEGWNTEYGGMMFAFFMLTDYLRALLGSFLIVLLFLGGWTMPGWVPAAATSFPLAGIFWFMLKVYIVFTVFVWIRASLPRVRTDQLLRVGWNRMVPLALLSVVLAALLVTVKCLPVLGCIPTLGG
ncbi:MAG: NADH-quinone oxidoreductase subunit NuoH [Candidatus Thermoplasmatota archaeon]|jgi:NADH-quinone oxidoreductase subunit H|nr:NADH-quinone oxidoreductase subunit NuoH [Candidatus Thermoplasmatota archaeon]